MSPKYPNIRVQLSGEDGNAYYIMGKIRRALLDANVPQEEVDLFLKEAMAGDYDNLLATCLKWVDVH